MTDIKRLTIDQDDLGLSYLHCGHSMSRVTMMIRIGLVEPGDQLGHGRLARLTVHNHPHRVEIERSDLPSYFEAVGDLVQEEVVDWIAERTSFDWSVDYQDADDEDDTKFLVYSFANAADAVAFKLRWADRVRS